MKTKILTKQEVEHRAHWVGEIGRLSGDFSIDSDRIEKEISDEIRKKDILPLLGHLRLCGAIPERYGHDSSEEKLYSKYTDVVIHGAFKAMGLKSLVLKERADVADVECVCAAYSFVADAKAFRLSRTAKNQKDFKVEAMDNWKHGKPYAMVVCPVYQLPTRSSQIYLQAAARNVTIVSYTHLSVLVRYAEQVGKPKAQRLLHSLFKTVEAMNPSKNAVAYWQAVNGVFLSADHCLPAIWREEKVASTESIVIARDEALSFLAAERERIMRLSRQQAIQEVMKWRKLENRVRAVKSVVDNGLLTIGDT